MTTTSAIPRIDLRSLALPVILAVIQVVGAWGASRGQLHRDRLDWLGVLLLLIGPAMLSFRRRLPVLTLVVAVLTTLVYLLSGYPYGPVVLSVIVALFNAVRMGHRLAAWIASGGMVVAHYAIGALLEVPDSPSLTSAVTVSAWLMVVLIGAEVARSHAERREDRKRAQEAEAAGKVTEERLRIARELHDVVAHNISLINVQAGVALHLMDAKPEQARTALSTIKQASKEALVELRSVLGVLRQVDEGGPRQPTPGLARLDELAERARQAGLQVEVDRNGEPRSVPTGVDVAAFRIIQEAVTNVVRHANARSLSIFLSYGKNQLVVDVLDDGRGHPQSSQATLSTLSGQGSGAGLLGMRERAVALGGMLEAGPRAEGGFRVRAELPIESNESPDPQGEHGSQGRPDLTQEGKPT